MSKGGGLYEFPAASKYDKTEKKHFTVQTITCGKPGCTRSDFIRKSGERLKPVSMLAEKFRQRGWDVGHNRAHDLCPDHAKTPGAKTKDRKSKAQLVAAYGRIHREGQRKPRPVEVRLDTRAIVDEAKKAGVLAKADPIGEVETLAIDKAAERLASLGRVTRKAEPVAPAPVKPPPAPKKKPVLRVSTPMFDPPMGTEVWLIRDGKYGQAPRQTGFKPTGKGGSWSNVRKSALLRLGADAVEGEDYVLFADPTDDTLGWKPLRKTPEPAPQPAAPAAPLETEAMTDTTAPVRAYTRDERRKAMDGLEVSYDVEKGRYRGNGSDRALAEQLNLPRALITEVREQFFGPDQNESADLALKELASIRDDAQALYDRHIALAADAEAIVNRCNKVLPQ